MPTFPDLLPLLTDGAVALRLAADRDIPEVLIAHQDDRRLAEALWLERPPSGAELGRRVEGSAAARAAGLELWLTVLAAGSDECRGQLEVREVDAHHARARLAIWIAPGDRRRGLGCAALRLAGGWLLRECGLERVALFVDPGDPAIGGATTRAGFTGEGVLRGYRLTRSGRADVEAFSLVRADLGEGHRAPADSGR